MTDAVLHRDHCGGLSCGPDCPLRGYWVVYKDGAGKLTGGLFVGAASLSPTRALMLAYEHSHVHRRVTTCPNCFPGAGRSR